MEGILNTFVQRYNVINEVLKVNPSTIQEIVEENKVNYVTMESLDKNKQPRAIDYYGVTMTSLIILYAAMTAGFGMNSERVRRTGSRMLVSPVRKNEIFMGKVLGFLAVTIIEIAIVVLSF